MLILATEDGEQVNAALVFHLRPWTATTAQGTRFSIKAYNASAPNDFSAGVQVASLLIVEQDAPAPHSATYAQARYAVDAAIARIGAWMASDGRTEGATAGEPVDAQEWLYQAYENAQQGRRGHEE